MTTPPVSCLSIAHQYIEAGYSVIPVKMDGTKAPDGEWKAFQKDAPTDSQLVGMFSRKRGIGLVHGKVSGNSLVIDIDAPHGYDDLAQLCADHGRADLLSSLVRVETPDGGTHLYFRCAEPVEGNEKLSWWAEPVSVEVAEALTEEERKQQNVSFDTKRQQWVRKTIKSETRGQGGMTVAPGSPARVHKQNKPYHLVSGSFKAVPVVSLDDLNFLLAMCRATNEYVEPTAPAKEAKPVYSGPRSGSGTGKRPGEDYDERGTLDQHDALIKSSGYREIGRRSGPYGEIIDYTRPGKSAGQGLSATLNACGPNIFYVFTSNSHPFESAHGYTQFGTYIIVKANGDASEAARQLGAQGYGDQTPAGKTRTSTGQGGSRSKPAGKKAESGTASEGETAPEDSGGTTEAASAIASVYEISPQGTFWNRRTEDGIKPVQLANFGAYIEQDTIEDDGAETRRRFTIKASLPGQPAQVFDMAASEFAGMDWPIERMGSRALVAPGRGMKDHVRAAIQTLSDPIEKRVHTHTGWVERDKAFYYCHAGGTAGAIVDVDGDATAPGCDTVHDGEEVAVSLSGSLSRFNLPPAPTGDLQAEAVRSVLRLWKLGKADVVLPLAIAPWRAVLGSCDFSLFVAGPTGVFKSQIAALAEQHFGKEMNSRNLPADWSSTDNYLEGLAFVAKDALLVIDEFVPRGATSDRERHHAKADRVLRAQGNNSAKGRMRADGTLRPSKPPRGLILSTGEEIPSGQSLRARLLIVEVSAGDIPAHALTACQKDASEGLYAQAMAGYLAWLAERYRETHDNLPAEVETLRAKLPASAQPHARTAEIVCHLVAGVRHFLQFALDMEIITKEEGEELVRHVWKTLCIVCARQGALQKENEPATRFVELLAAALSAGRCHVAGMGGDVPEKDGPGNWGWRVNSVGGGAYERSEWRPLGDCVGYVNAGDLYLLPDASYGVVERLSRESGDGVAVRPKTLSKRLHEKGMLASVASDGLTIKVQAAGRRLRVWHVATTLLQGEGEQKTFQ